MLETTSGDPEVLAVSFEHPQIQNFVTVLINGSSTGRVVKLQGQGLPRAVDVYVTSATETLSRPVRESSQAIVLPPRSVATAISGSHLDRVERAHCPGRRHR
jgi:hypothetical protein